MNTSKSSFYFLGCAIALIFNLINSGCSHPSAEVKVTNLRCEYLENPLSIDKLHPHLSWQSQTSRRNYRQKAYRVLVASDQEKLTTNEPQPDLWDSGIVEADQSSGIAYEGEPLESSKRYYWQVQVWSDQDEVVTSDIYSWEMGLLHPSDWQGEWICHTLDSTAQPAPMFRKEFTIEKELHSARAYISGLGYYELRMNGEKIGDRLLDPAFTDYEDRALYATYDVTEQLQQGENAIGIVLGNGWYNVQTLAVWDFETAPWRHSPSAIMQVQLEYIDGTTEVIATGTTWKTSAGPLVFNSIYSGEIYDARLEKEGWDKPGYNDTDWQNAIQPEKVVPQLVAQSMPPIRVTRELAPVNITNPQPNIFVADFGQNIAGITSLQISGKAGDTISVKHGEALYPDGMVDLTDIDVYVLRRDSTQDFQKSMYILKGEGEESYEPRFTYYGFQYAEITVPDGYMIKPENIKAKFVHTDVKSAGSFQSSDTLLNQIHESTQWSYLSNLHGYFTDCPQREKNGWTGDANLASDLGIYNYFGINVYKKWLRDLADGQKENGELPVIAPTGGWGYWQEPVWDGAFTNIPMNLYLYYGDQEMIAALYDRMKLHFSFWQEKADHHLIDAGLGDWLAFNTQTPRAFTSSVFHYYECVLLARFAGYLNKPEDVAYYSTLALEIKQAINAAYFKAEECSYANGSQTALSCALYFGIVEKENTACVAEALADKIKANDTRLDVGLLGGKFILNTLSEHGYTDLAYALASSEELPSWGYWVKRGFTTLLENWDPDADQDISLNHIMLGEVDAWFYKYLGGIQADEEAPGFKHILLKPYFAKDLEWVEVSHQSLFGEIKSHWKREGDKISWEIIVPPNTTASVYLPAGAEGQVTVDGSHINGNEVIADDEDKYFNVGSGTYVVKIAE